MKPINSRADLEALRGTDAYLPALRDVAGAATVIIDIAERPPDYEEPTYAGPQIAPQWEERDDDAILRRLGISRSELMDELSGEQRRCAERDENR